MQETERLILRRYHLDEEYLLPQLFTDPEVVRYVDDGKILSKSDLEYLWYRIHQVNYIENKIGVWGIFCKSDGHYIGHAAIKPRPENNDEWEIVYYLLKSEWGKGYAAEAAEKIIEFGFNSLNLKTIYATVDEGNISSIKILDKIGMKFLRYEQDEMGRFMVYARDRND